MAAHMVWELEPDEALIVEMDNHDGFWIFGMGGVFVGSMDFLYRPVSYTPARTAVDSDDVVRFVLAHDDPGVHNWLDTQGFSHGNLTYRNLMSQNSATFRTRLVHAADVLDACRRTPPWSGNANARGSCWIAITASSFATESELQPVALPKFLAAQSWKGPPHRPTTRTCRTASITRSGWFWWMLCPLSAAMSRRAWGTRPASDAGLSIEAVTGRGVKSGSPNSCHPSRRRR